MDNKTLSQIDDEIIADIIRKKDISDNQNTYNTLAQVRDNVDIDLSSSNVKGSAFSGSNQILKDIENLDEKILALDNAIELTNKQIKRYDNKPTSQVVLNLSNKQSEYKKERDNLIEQKRTLGLALDKTINTERSSFASGSPLTTPSTTEETINANAKKLANPDSVGNPSLNDTLFNSPTDQDYMEVASNLLASAVYGLDPQYVSTPYKAENFLLGGGQGWYDMLATKAKAQGEDAYAEFMDESDVIRPKLEQYATSPELLALIEIARKKGIKTDEQLIGLLFNDFKYNQNAGPIPDSFDVDAEGTLQGVQNIIDGKFDTKEAKRIINRLGLKGQEKLLQNSLIVGSGGSN